MRLRAVVLLALRDRPERNVLHRCLDVVRRLAEIVVNVCERLVRVALDQLHRVVVGRDECLHLIRMLLDEARGECDVVGDDRRVLLRRDEHVPVRVLLGLRQPWLPRHRDLHASRCEGCARVA